MTRPDQHDRDGTGLEARLEGDLRALTDGVDRPRTWRDDAGRVLARAAEQGGSRRLRWLALAGATAAGAAAVVLAAVLYQPLADPGVSPTAVTSDPASASASGSADGTPRPTGSPPAELPDLATIAWWDAQTFGFGYVEPPSPDDPVPPDAYTQVRVGTLDGRVSAMLLLPMESGHWYVGRPVNGEVLVAEDTGTASVIRAVAAATGEVVPLMSSTEIIAAVAPLPSGIGFYYGLVDRESGEEIGVFFGDRAGSRGIKVDDAPPEWREGELGISRLEVSPDGQRLVAQYCFGAVRCVSNILDLDGFRVSARRQTDAISWIEGFLGREAYGRSTKDRSERIRIDLDTLVTHPLTEIPRDAAVRPESYAVELPPGWFAHWPPIAGDSLGLDATPRPVKLERLATREMVETPPLTLSWPGGCEPVVPSELPSGRVSGSAPSSLEDGQRRVTYGSGDDLVLEWLDDLDVAPENGTAVSIRGRTGQLTWGSPLDFPPNVDVSVLAVPVIVWSEGGCTYQIFLPGLTPDEAIDYASRF
jgi:hypothetical protein